MIKKFDLMILATFITTLFYSATYPYIYVEIMKSISNQYVAITNIITCLSTILFSALWNKKSNSLFKLYPIFCVIETVISLVLLIYLLIFSLNLKFYYIANTIIFAIITRNICCGGIKLRTKRYPTEKEREKFDNTNNSFSAAATLIGSGIAIVLKLPIEIMLTVAFIGNIVDNVFYIIIFKQQKRNDEYHIKLNEY